MKSSPAAGCGCVRHQNFQSWAKPGDTAGGRRKVEEDMNKLYFYIDKILKGNVNEKENYKNDINELLS